MQRRTFLKSLGALPVMAYFSHSSLAQQNQQKVLILVQFGGGNDSLNMFVPYSDPAYYAARTSLAIDAQDVLPMNANLGMNPVMGNLSEAWQTGDMAVVQGLGYPEPNRSHFRSIEIWQTASDAHEVLTQGWLNSLLPESDFPLQGVMISGSPVALKGEANQFSLNSNSGDLTPVFVPAGVSSTAAVAHIVQQRQSYNQALDIVNSAFEQEIELTTDFANDEFSQDCKLVAETLAAGIRPSVMHLSLGSFDTHSNQRASHDALLSQLANGLAALRTELIAQGLWQHVCIASYSEFGRRLTANASLGTDHGTAASHFVLGGEVNGGIFGQAPSLTNLDNGDLIFTQDFRQYYRTLADWMQWQPSSVVEEFANLGFI
ncbi:DUF1501 domain-containing protein [Paraglaciecola aestuariivivens]